MFPGAKQSKVRAKDYGPRHTDHPVKIVFHTTETTGVPAYNDGAFAPHYTFDPKSLTWHYHGVPETRRVGTLVGSRTAGVKTNELAIQVEIICYSSKSIASDHPSRLWVGDLSDAALDELGLFVAYGRAIFGVGTQFTPTPKGGWKYGTTASTRLSRDEWLGLAGFTAHGAVPGNKHWDTGVLDLAEIHRRSIPKPEPDPGDDDMDEATLRKIIREELDRSQSGKPGPVNGFYGIGQSVIGSKIGRSGLSLAQMIQTMHQKITSKD